MPEEKIFVKAASITDIEKRREPTKHYVYIITVLWSDNKKQVICRRYNAFFELQTSLIDAFPDESGVADPTKRILPFLPGKVLFGRSNVREVALKRKDGLNEYIEKLIKLPAKISRAELVMNFLEASEEDVKTLLAGGEKRVKKEKTADSISDPVLLEQYIVITNYKKTQRNQVSLAQGDTVEVIEKHENGWWFVCIEDEQGWAPSSYLEPVDGKQDEVEEVDCTGKEGRHICTKAFKSTMPDEVALKLGDVVDILAKCSDGWWKVQLSNDKQGYVPLNHLKKIPKNAEGDLMKTVMEQSEKSPKNKIKRFETAPRKKTIRRKAQDEQLTQQAKGININGNKNKADDKVIYVASSSFKAVAGQGNLNFAEGAELEVVEKSPNGWWYVKVNGEEGWVPSTVAQRQRGMSALRWQDAMKKVKVIKPKYRTVGGYKATEDTGISFQPGMHVEVLEKDPCGWWFVRINKEEGWAPSTFLEEVTDNENNNGPALPPPRGNTKSTEAAPPVPAPREPSVKEKPEPKEPEGELYIALGDYNDGDIGMLSFTKGQKIYVLEKDDGGWWMAMVGEQSGWVPSNFLGKE